MAPLRNAAKFDTFLSLDCTGVEGGGSKERKGSNFAIWQPCIQYVLAGFLIDDVSSIDDVSCEVTLVLVMKFQWAEPRMVSARFLFV